MELMENSRIPELKQLFLQLGFVGLNVVNLKKKEVRKDTSLQKLNRNKQTKEWCNL